MRARQWSSTRKEGLDEKAQRWFIQKIQRLTDDALDILLACGQGKTVYVYDPHECCSHLAAPGEIPWLCEYALSFNKKHIFERTSLPGMSSVAKNLFQWEHRCRWRLAMKNEPKDQWASIRSRTTHVRHCDALFNEQTENFFAARANCL